MGLMDSSPCPPLTPKNPPPAPRLGSHAEKNDIFRIISSSSPTPSSSSSSSSSSHPRSPFSSHSSSIPFSWESQPGIPKASPTKPTSTKPTLPLPPPLRSGKQPHRRHPPKKSNAMDPFTMALIECSKDDVHWKTDSSSDLPPAKKWVDRRRRALGLMTTFDLYASCKSTSSVADSSIYVRRPDRGSKFLGPAYGILPRRPE